MNKESLRKLCAIHLLLEMICKGKDTIMIKNTGWDIVADNGGLYPEDMGEAARKEFHVEDV